MQTKIAGCYCDETFDGECCICRDSRQESERTEEARSWSWNLSPRECAQRAIELEWSVATLTSAMLSAGFKDVNVNAVVYEYEISEWTS
jgi:hypothetical protein